MTSYSYVGSELDVFSHASNWKAYYKSLIQSYLEEEVLEVGAGIGATTKSLCDGQQHRWICLEPDPALATKIKPMIDSGELPKCCEVRVGTLSDLSPTETFNVILYIDVLEHIENDRAEVIQAAKHLKDGGVLIVLSPAHQWLFTPFDKAIGHFRRYNKRSLSALIPSDLTCVKLIYLDSVGSLVSSGNRLILKSDMPTSRQITFWDKIMIPLSQRLDPVLQYSVGKSILGIWRR